MAISIVLCRCFRWLCKAHHRSRNIAPTRSTRRYPHAAKHQPTVIATSANISGQPTCTSGIEVFRQHGRTSGFVLDAGVCTRVGSSTVDITEPYGKRIREGAIPEKEVADCLQGM